MNSLDRRLELFSFAEPTAGAVQDAQRKLESVIAGATPRARKPRVGGWLAAAASAVVAAVAVVLLPLNPSQAMAFSEVQKHFRDFQKLRFDMEQRVNGHPLMKSRIAVLADGSVRTEVGDDIVVVVNTQERRVLTLVKAEHVAVVSPLPAPGTKDDAMDWLSDIRDFQGLATPLSETRLIDGRRAHGWELALPDGQGKVLLWADEAGLPLEMKVDQPNAAIDTSFRFEFEPALPADYFSTEVPAGYTLQPTED